jgi:Uma2 family endonuclease
VVSDDRQSVFEAADVAFVVEVVSPGNAAAERVLKMQLYALAGIPWYLLVQHAPLELKLFRLEGPHYAEHSMAVDGDIMRLAEPFPAEIVVDRLLRRRS